MTKEECVKFYVWQRNNCNKVDSLKDIRDLVDRYFSEREQPQALDMHNVSQQRELLLSAICQFTKRNTQKEIQEVEKWIETGFRK